MITAIENEDAELAALLQWFVHQPPRIRRMIDTVVATPAVGRNEPCPCGSGSKYKRCCIGNDGVRAETWGAT